MPMSDQALFEKGLPIRRKTRSLLNLAMLTALNRPAEFKLHVKGALNE
jgi:alkylhydroperoxidase/carboxymuconolactone decarboxylase family protein YurZ